MKDGRISIRFFRAYFILFTLNGDIFSLGTRVYKQRTLPKKKKKN